MSEHRLAGLLGDLAEVVDKAHLIEVSAKVPGFTQLMDNTYRALAEAIGLDDPPRKPSLQFIPNHGTGSFGLTSCCGYTILELPRNHRLTNNEEDITCRGIL